MEKKTACPSQTALEEYAVALRIGAPDPAILAHLKVCKRCRYRAEALQKESDSFLSFLQSACPSPVSPCPDSITLAAYLDKALDPEEKNKIEQHLAACRPCQQVLKSINGETGASGARETEPDYVHAPEPVALADRKRTKRTPEPSGPPQTTVGDTADGEQRKKRLSSDFD
jgi:predicted anti-sigma-YlaC factor YlaD